MSNKAGATRSGLGADTEDTIFVSIAAYRDPELAATVEDCLAKARRPDRLRFGICWQHGPSELAPDRFADRRFRVLDVDWHESRGPCWARSRIMKLWEGERWYLQLDSHHRFAPDWDAKLLAQAAATGSPKPILSTYPGSFYPENPTDLSDVPPRMDFGGFTRDGLVTLHPDAIADWETSTLPRRARFLAAGFLFAPGSFATDVPYDPYLYFFGEEITLTVRAFTHGYDFYHPGEVILWHEYTRAHQPHHWGDHIPAHGVELEWGKRDARSRKRAQRLLTKPKPGTWGVGMERSLADYEAYAGISFAHRRIQDHTRRHLEPPNPPTDEDWLTGKTNEHTVEITLPTSRLPAAAWQESQFWYVGFHDWEDGEELFRGDAGGQEVRNLLAGTPEYVTLIRKFESATTPTAWMVHPYSASEAWLDPPIRGKLIEDGAGQWKGTVTTESTPATADHESQKAEALRRDADLFDRCPQATPGLSFSETEDGFSVTPAGSETPFLLSSTGVLILELANGRYSVSEIIDVVGETFGLDGPPHAQVLAFLDSASLCGLVHPDTIRRDSGPKRGPRPNRRKRGSK
jgi:hypothetical protein